MAEHAGEPITCVELGVGGMTCDDCVVHVKEALESVDGVEEAAVDLEGRTAVVRVAGDVPQGALATAVRDTGAYNAFERGRRSS